MALTIAQIQQAYVTFFSRPADVAGLNYWEQYTGSLQNLYASFALQPEYAAAFDGLANIERVNLVYQNLFSRDGDLAGLEYWALQLDKGTVTLANLSLALAAGALGNDVVTLQNKVSAATTFTNELDTAQEALGYNGEEPFAAAKAWLQGITDNASLAAAIAPAALNASITEVITAPNDAPVAGAAVAVSVAENLTNVGTYAATDADGDTLTYTLTGADAAKFTVNAAGAVSFVAAPNFEAPASSLGTNSYNFNVVASDGALSSSQAVTVNVTNVNEAPVSGAAATASVAEGSTVVGTYSVTDVDAGDTHTYTLTGADAAKFAVSASGQVSFIAAPNFEAPGSAANSNAYSFNFVATDAGGLTSSQAVTVNVTNVNEAPTAAAVQAPAIETNVIDGSQILSGNLRTAGAAADVDVPSTLTFSLLSGAPGFSLAANGDWTFNPAATAFQSLKAGQVANYTATYQVSDGALTASNTVTFTVTGTNDLPIATDVVVGGYENMQVTGQVTATDVDGDTLTYAASGAVNGTVVMEAATGNYVFTPAANFNGLASFTYTANDGTGNSEARTVTINLVDVVNILTAQQDNIVLINSGAEAVIGTNNNLNAGDVITGGATDSLVLSVDGSVANNDFAAFQLNGVGTFQVTNDDNSGSTTEVTFDMSSSTGVRTLVSLNSTSDVRFNFANTNADSDGDLHDEVNLQVLNLTDGVSVTLDVRNDDAVGLDEVNLLVTDSDDDGIDAASINITAAGTGAVDQVTNAGVEVVNLSTGTSLGEVRIDDLNTPGATTLNIATVEQLVIGDQTVGLNDIENALSASVQRVNAAGSAGDIALSTEDSTLAVSITGGSGNDTFETSNTLGDSVDGGAGNDTIRVGGGNNSVIGGAGLDTITSGAGNDTISGGLGNDSINAGAGNNVVDGNEGADAITVGSDNDDVDGGDDNDTINAGDGGDDTLSGGNGDDTFNLGATLASGYAEDGTHSLDQIDGGSGNDTLNLTGDSGDANELDSVINVETINLTGAGNFNIQVNDGSWFDTDTNATDTDVSATTINATGLTGAATLNFQGNDGSIVDNGVTLQNEDGVLSRAITVLGGGNNDTIVTGLGADSIQGGNGADSIFSGAGNDTIDGAQGNDSISMEAGDDLLIVQGGQLDGLDTLISGGSGNDTIQLLNPSSNGFVNVTALLGNEVSGIQTLQIVDTDGFNDNTVSITIGGAAGNYDNLEPGQTTSSVLAIDGSQLDAGESLQVFTQALDAEADGVDEDFNITGGAGADQFWMGNNLDSGDTINGGLGNDVIASTGNGAGDARFTNVDSVETYLYQTAHSATLAGEAQDADIVTVTGSAGNDTLIASAYTVGLTVNGNDGDDNLTTGSAADTINGGTGNDTIVAGAGNDVVTNNDTAGAENIDLGAGNDILVVTGNNAFSTNDIVAGGADTDTVQLNNATGAVTANVNLSNVTDVEQYVTVDQDREPTDTPFNFTINFSGGNVTTLNTITVDASSLTDDDGDALTVDLSALADKDYSFNIFGGNGNDTVVGSSLPENLNFQAGAGADRLEIDGTDLGTTVTTDGGSGRDTIAINTGSVTDDSFVSVTNYEILTATAGLGLVQAQLGQQAQVAGIDSIIGGVGNDNVLLNAAFDPAALAVDLSAGGNDTINAAASTAVVTFQADAADITVDDVLTGGSTANDVMRLTADNATADLSGVRSVNTFVVVESVANNTDNSIGITITNATFGAVAGHVTPTVITVDARALDDVDVNGAGGAGIEGGMTLNANVTAGAMSVFGGTGNDNITTGSGNDFIDLGEGNDFVSSGSGNDTIVNLGGNNTVLAGDGNDSVTLADGDNSVLGGDGNDTITVGNGANFVDGGTGDDTITVTAGTAGNAATTNTLIGGVGNDIINVSASNAADANIITGGAGADTVTLGAGHDTVRYVSLSDSTGDLLTPNRDTIKGFDTANDKIAIESNVLSSGAATHSAFVGNGVDFSDVQGAVSLTAHDGNADIVYQKDNGKLWVDVNDDGILNGLDLQINIRNADGSIPSSLNFNAGDFVYQDTIAPEAPTLDLLDADDSAAIDDVTNIAAVDIIVSFNNTATDGTAVKVGDTVKLMNGATLLHTLVLDNAAVIAGSVVFAVNLNANAANNLTATVTDQGVLPLSVLDDNTSLAGALTVTHDNALPTASSIVLSDSDIDFNQTSTVTVTFNERVSGVDTADFTADNGTLSAFASNAAGTVWTSTFTPNAGVSDATNVVTLTAAASGISDVAGNLMVANQTSANYTIDTLAPTAVSMTLVDNNIEYLGDRDRVAVSFTSGETYVVRNVSQGLSDPFLRIYAPDGTTLLAENDDDGVSLNSQISYLALSTGTFFIEASNLSDAGVGNYQLLVNGNPVNTNEAAFRNGETATLVVTFNEAVSGVDVADFAAQSGTLGAFTSGDGITWSSTFTPASATTDATNDITLVAAGSGIVDVGGSNPLTVNQSTANYTVDTVAPTLTITDNAAGVATGPVTYTFTFSEAVNGFAPTDVVVVNGTAAAAFATGVNGDAVYTLVVTPTAGFEGNMTVDVAANSAFDLADSRGNGNVAATQSVQVVDTLAPTITVADFDGADEILSGSEDDSVTISGTTNAAVGATVTVSSGVTLGTATVVAGVGLNTWSLAGANLSGLAQGAITVTASVADANGNVGTGTETTNHDSVGPAVSITSASYNNVTNTLVLTGTGFETTGTIDATKMTWDVNGDGATTLDFVLTNALVQSATVTDATHATIVLTTDGGAGLEGMTGFAGSVIDKVKAANGLATDAVGNAGTVTNAGVNVDIALNLTGTDNADNMFGGPLGDTLSGGLQNDTITGGAGADSLTGGLGADTFVIGSTGDGADTIQDFSVAQGDVLDLSGIALGDTIVTNVSVAGGAGTLLAAGVNVIVYTADNTVDTAAEVDAMLLAQNGSLNQHQDTYILTDNGTDTYVWVDDHLDITSGGAGVTLVATLVGVADASTIVIGTNFQG